MKDLGHSIIGGKYGDNPSGHSSYQCENNCGNDASLTEEELRAQQAAKASQDGAQQ